MTAQPLPVDPALASHLADARLQLHHAAQMVTAIGISYLPHQADDSHTNLGWIDGLGALASHQVRVREPFRIALRFADLALLLLDARNATVASFALNGRTVASAADWIRGSIGLRGADSGRFTLDKHYTIPSHPVGMGAAFDGTNATAFDQLSRWYAGANSTLGAVSSDNHGDVVRCWPHHFDIATLLPTTGAAIGVGMEPGDTYYDEPYYYVNKHPQPAVPPSVALAGNGAWHSREWIGAVLVGSKINTEDQQEQIQSFIASAIESYSEPAPRS